MAKQDNTYPGYKGISSGVLYTALERRMAAGDAPEQAGFFVITVPPPPPSFAGDFANLSLSQDEIGLAAQDKGVRLVPPTSLSLGEASPGGDSTGAAS